MARKLKISAQLALPLDTETSTGIVYGGKGMGKTNFGAVLAEECHKAGIHFAVIDPMGVWWGLRHSPNGKGPGIEVLILGGVHGDIPIEPTGGAVVADLVVDERADVIVDISRRPDGTMWSIADRVRFVRDYCKRLYQRQGEKRRPVLQFIDEAARFVPQVIRKDDSDVAACMGAIAVLVEEGRNVAIGIVLLTQRSARLNKDVAELADCMIAFRTVGPNSRRAVLDWLGEHVEKEKIKDYDQQLRALPRGTALVVSPGWLEYEGIAAMRMRETFDSSATPKRGRQRRVTGGAKPDLAKYRQLMAATIEKAKAEDPKELKKQIRELEAALSLSSKRIIQAVKNPQQGLAMVGLTKQPKDRIVKVPALSSADRRLIARALMVLRHSEALNNRLQQVKALAPMKVTIDKAAIEATRPDEHAFVKFVERELPKAGRRAVKKALGLDDDAKLKLGARRMGTVLADWRRPLTKVQLATLAKIVPGSGTFYNYVRSLERAGLVSVDGDRIALTPAGVNTFPATGESPRTGRQIADAFARQLKKGARRMLDLLLESPYDKHALAHAAGIVPGSGTFYNYLRSLERNGLAEQHDGQVRVHPTLLLELS